MAVRSAGMCERCGCIPWVEAHHRRARGMGSTKRPETNSIVNALGLCGVCHRHVESWRLEAMECGWLVRQAHDPALVPVLYRRQWALLTAEGTVTYVDENSECLHN